MKVLPPSQGLATVCFLSVTLVERGHITESWATRGYYLHPSKCNRVLLRGTCRVAQPSRLFVTPPSIPAALYTFLMLARMLWPSTKASPDVMLSSPVSILKVVVLPAPLKPRRPKHSPLLTAKEILSTASRDSRLS